MSESDNDNDSLINYNKLVWNTAVEKLFVSWCDLAACYKWLHEKSYHKYRKINYMFAIPIIVLSTLTGTANIGIGGLVPPNAVQTANVAIGLVSITTGIIGTLQNFFRYPQLSEAHLNAYTGWSRLQRLINTELNLERKARRNTGDFLKICRNEFERLMEQSPLIPPDVGEMFSKKFGKDKSLNLPDSLNHIKHTTIYPDSEEEELDMLLQNEKMKDIFNKKINDVIKTRESSKEVTNTLKEKLRNKLLEDKLKESAEKTLQKMGSSQNTPRQHFVPVIPEDIPKSFTERIPREEREPRKILDGEVKVNIKDIIKKLEKSNIPQATPIKPSKPSIPELPLSEIGSQITESQIIRENEHFSIVENKN